MPYIMNPHLPKIRMQAVRMVKSGQSTRAVASHFGFDHSTVVRWMSRVTEVDQRSSVIPTRSSRPHHHPKQLADETVQAILSYRQRYRRCAEFLYFMLARDGYVLSLSSVKRTLRRQGLVNHSPWKKWHQYPPRPIPKRPGILVEIDTIHSGPGDDRLYIYTLIDVCSRWAWAVPAERITTHRSLRFVEAARKQAPFLFQTIQSDHGQEFSKWLTVQLQAQHIAHRHSRIRTPTDNGHLERFNRTIQDECLARTSRSLRSWRQAIPEYIHYYNTERPHLGLNMKTPLQVVRSY
jgi:transposase InsO family protein